MILLHSLLVGIFGFVTSLLFLTLFASFRYAGNHSLTPERIVAILESFVLFSLGVGTGMFVLSLIR